MKHIIVSCCLLIFAGCCQRDNIITGQQNMRLQTALCVELEYLLFLPDQYEQQEEWPLILFLHGGGERGDNLEQVKKHGIPKIVDQEPDFPFVVVSPQCPANRRWPQKVSELLVLLDQVEANYKIDKERIYLTGLSMGGYGTWTLAAAEPKRFAAAAPICGGGDPVGQAVLLKELPIWVFHGEDDGIVNVYESKRMVDAIKKHGGTKIKLTVYPDTGHDSWTRTYENPELYEWFLKHKNTAK